ncbi:putative MFS transporter [Aulographum hederae CBS 113979]|uniref:Putative MFS transporter n=1 Tax=Aulographum hederae CBS 113979 TaxID=1176131 RepID=A0A6G1HFD1_9PEZI|nr:putative MFS transporter [Aulographum hederae CBS 113979]
MEEQLQPPGVIDIEKQQQASQPSELTPIHTTFTRNQVRFIVTMTTLASFFSPLSGQIYFPAIPDLAAYYNTSTGNINLTITTYMILQGLAPTIMGTFGDTTGRRPAYIVTFIIYFAANIGLATQKSYAALLVLRCLQSAGSSGTVALGYGVISDVATPAERGKYLGPVAAGVMLAPAIGPTIGGLLAQFLGWRAIFWFLTIICGIYLAVYAVFMPETARIVVGDGSIVPTEWYTVSPLQYWRARQAKKKASLEDTGRIEEKLAEMAEKRKFRFPNPLKAVVILKEKDALIIILIVTTNMIGLLDMLAVMPTLFGEVYGFNTLQVSLCYLPVGVAAMLAAIVNGKIMDYNYRRHAIRLGFPLEKKRGQDLSDFPIEKARLQPLFIIIPVGLLAYLPFGWVLQERVSLAVPLIMLFICGFCSIACSNTLTSLLLDLFPEKPATATAACNLVRCWLAGAATAVISYMLDGMGWGWTFFFLGLLSASALPMLYLECRSGMRWRAARRTREEKEVEEKA